MLFFCFLHQTLDQIKFWHYSESLFWKYSNFQIFCCFKYLSWCKILIRAHPQFKTLEYEIGLYNAHLNDERAVLFVGEDAYLSGAELAAAALRQAEVSQLLQSVTGVRDQLPDKHLQQHGHRSAAR